MTCTLIKNGTIIDGTGSDAFNGHVLIEGQRIAAVIPSETDDGRNIVAQKDNRCIDAGGLVVSPGFIDCHSHFDWALPLAGHPAFLFPMVEQGVTTVVTGNCGFSPAPVTAASRQLIGRDTDFLQETPLSFDWDSMGDFLDHLAQGGGLLFNTAQLTGHGPLHLMTVGDNTRLPDSAQMTRMAVEAKKTFDEGAWGLSLGLMYPPGLFSRREHLTALARAAAERDRVLTVHIKALSRYSPAYPIIPIVGRPHNLKALDEILAIGLETGVKLQISHLIFVGKKSWPTAGRAIRMIENARDRGLAVMWDIYPHFCGNSYLSVFLPEWYMADLGGNLTDPRANKKMKFELRLAARLLGFKMSDIQIMQANYPAGEAYNGRNLEEIGRSENLDPMDVMINIIRESRGRALQLTHGYSGDAENEQVIEKMMAHDLCLFETDTILKKSGFANPASYGAFPRILGHFVREKKTLGLTDAICRMSGKTARWLGLRDRGEVRSGCFADLVLFDPQTIADTTLPSDTARRPRGIHKVMINGAVVVENGRYRADQKAGQVLRCA